MQACLRTMYKPDAYEGQDRASGSCGAGNQTWNLRRNKLHLPRLTSLHLDVVFAE